MRVKPFQALRPDPSIAKKVAALPYDVVSTDEVRELIKGNPVSFLRVARAEAELPASANPYGEETYQKALDNFKWMQDKKHLIRESEPCMFIYQQKMGNHVQRGITAICHIEDYENDIIKKHEKTRPVKENDRLKLNETLNAHPEPVFLTYKDREDINAEVNKITQTKPLYDFTLEDGVSHTVWHIPNAKHFSDAFAKVSSAYVADGHHRSASAARMGRARAEANPKHTGEEAYNWFLAVLFPASELNILPYNRVIKDLNGLSPTEFIEKLKKQCTVYENNAPSPEKPGQISIYLRERWFGLVRPEGKNLDPVSDLDVSYLQDNILGPILGIDDPRTSSRIDFVGGIRGTKELEQLVDSKKFELAFSMHPVTVDDIIKISDAGQIMSPKSTWFEPKLRSGLFVYTV
jgi:uncharacterized protein (DUF1015 family)